MKKIWMTVLSLFLFVLLLGCSSEQIIEIEKEAEQTSVYEKHLDLSLAYWDIDKALENRENDKVIKTIEEKFNVTIKPANITWDDYYQKIDLWANTGTLPDVFVGAFRTEASFFQRVAEGLLHEIPQDLSKYPNLEKYMDSPAKETCQIDEKTYCIFRQTYSEQAETVKDRTILYRWDLAQKAGITKEPETWDEFREMILAIMKNDSDGIGIQGMTTKGYNMLIGPLFTYSMPLAATGGAGFYWIEQEEGYIPALFAGEELGSNALPTWYMIREMYQEGTIEEDIFLTTTSQAEEKFLMGRNAAICIDGGISSAKTYENIGRYWKEIHGREFFEDVKALNIMQDVNGVPTYTVWDYAWSETYINAKVDEDKLDRILAIYDYLLSEEGIILSHFGVEGETYSLNQNGTIKLISEEKPSDVYPSINMFSSLVCWNYGNEAAYRYPITVPEEYVLADAKRVNMARECRVPKYNYECTKYFYQMDTDFSIDINNIFQRMMLDTKPVEEIWQEIIDEYKEKGLEQVIIQVNEHVSGGIDL